MIKRWLHVWLLILVGISFSAVIFVLGKRQYIPIPGYTLPLQPVSTGLIGEYAALVLIAENKGYFQEQGLLVTIREYPSGPEALAALLQGQVDTALGSDFAGVRNSFKGEDLKILANLSKSEAFYMIGRKDHGMHGANDLKGKKIGLTRKTVGEFYLGQFLTFNNLALDDITIVDMPQAELIKAVVRGEIDGAALFEPNAYQANTRLGENATRLSLQSNQSIYTLFYSTEKFISQDPAILERYMRAILRAEQFIKLNDTQSRAIVAQRLGYDDAYIDYIWPKFDFTVSLDEELLINMDDESRWVIENQVVPGAAQPNYLRLMHFSALEAVLPERITIIR